MVDRHHAAASLRHQVPRGKDAAVATGAGVHLLVHPDVRRTFDVAGLNRLVIAGEVLVGNVKQLRPRRPRRRLPILRARRRRSDIANRLASLG